MLLVVGGMIGGGKSSLTELVSERFGGQAFYEDTSSPVLEKFYTASDEEQMEKRYAFLLQLHFLDTRFKDIKHCLTVGDNPQVNCLDRSIYEDWYFAKVNMERGRISELEFSIYERLVDNMMEELEELPKKAPDLMLYLKGSFETFIKRIQKRSRDFEVMDEATREYFYQLWKGYDEWVLNHYKASEVLIIDIDKYDYVENEQHKEEVLEMVEKKLQEMELI